VQDDEVAATETPALGRPGQQAQPQSAAVGAAPGAVPRARSSSVELPLAGPGSPPPAGPDVQAAVAYGTPWQGAFSPPSRSGKGGRPARPRGARLANLPPGLWPESVAQQANDSAPRRARSPEDARNSMSSFQRGTRLGRGPSGHDNSGQGDQ